MGQLTTGHLEVACASSTLRRACVGDLPVRESWSGSSVGALAGLRGQPVNLGRGEVVLPLGEVPARVRGGLMRIECGFVAVQLIEDPLQRLALNRVRRIHQRSWLASADALDGLGDQPVVGLGADLVLTREPERHPENVPSSLQPHTPALAAGSPTTLAATSIAAGRTVSPTSLAAIRSRSCWSGSVSRSAASLNAVASRSTRLSAVGHCPTFWRAAGVTLYTSQTRGPPPVSVLRKST